MEINNCGQLALKTKNWTLDRFLVQTYLMGIIMLDDHSHEMRCFQNKSINLFYFKEESDKCLLASFDLDMPYWADPKKEFIKKKSTLYEQDRTFHLSQF